MRWIVFAALFLAITPTHADHRITVFGDSLSAAAHSWAEKLRADTVQVRNYAWDGLTLRDFGVPRWLTCYRFYGLRADQVLLWFGVNDAVFGSPHDYKVRLRDTLQILEGRGCTVYLMLPPLVTDRQETRKAITRIRWIANRTGREYDNVTIVDPYWDSTMTRDGVHQTDDLHELQAQQIREVLGL